MPAFASKHQLTPKGAYYHDKSSSRDIFAEFDSHQNMARVVNALEVAREFKEAGDDVQIIFDGGGTVAAAAVADPAHQMHGLYAAVEDKVAGVCRYCARAFDVYDKAEALHCPCWPNTGSTQACAAAWLTATQC